MNRFLASAPRTPARCLVAFLVWSFLAISAHGADCAIDTRRQSVAESTIEYRVAGSGPEVVLLHGLFAQKEQWDAVMCLLARAGYRVTAPDLPGYGRSTGFGISAYALERQVDLLDALVRSLGIGRHHLAGNSMGGAIAAMYANSHRDRVISLAFIGGTLGLGEWAPPLKGAIRSGVNPFIPVTVEQFDRELALLLVHVPTLTPDEKRAAIRPYQDDLAHYRQVWDIVGLYHSAVLALPVNRLPTLVLWGRQDQVFDARDAPLVVRRFPNGRIAAIDRAGHLAMLDAPDEIARRYGDFLGRLYEAAQKKKGR